MKKTENLSVILIFAGWLVLFSCSVNENPLTENRDPIKPHKTTRWIHSSIDAALPGKSWGTAAFTLADFDKDGDLDITISRREILSGQVYWYENRLNTWMRHNLGLSDEDQLGAVSADINRDGYPDLVVARYWFENPKILDESPDSKWKRHTYEGGLPTENHDIAAFDFDKDGIQDILSYSQEVSGGTLRLFNTTNFNTWSYHDVSTEVNNSVSQIADNGGVHGGFAPHGYGDLDGDSYADIVMPGGWYKNPGNANGDWLFNSWPFNIGITPNPYGISFRSWVVDLDSDGDNDIVYTDCDMKGSQGYWIENMNGQDDGFVRHSLPSPGDPTGSFHSLAVADFDKDGDFDIFSGEQEDSSPGMKPLPLNERGFMWENLGTDNIPVFVVKIIQRGNPGWHEILVGDVDGDDDQDIVSKIWKSDGGSYHADLWINSLY